MRSQKAKRNPYLDLIRIENSVMASVAVGIGVLAVDYTIPVAKIFYAVFSAFLISASSFAINDLCDKELDKETGRDNPLTEGRITDANAALVAVSSSLTGVYASVFSDSLITVSLAIFGAFLAFFYSVVLKPRFTMLGHLATSYSVGITYVYGWSVFDFRSLAMSSAVFFMFAISLMVNFSRELIKTIADYKGDAKWGIKTLPVRKGPEKGREFTARVALIVMIIAALFSYVPFALGVFHSAYLVVMTSANFLSVLLALLICLKPTEDMALRVKKDLLGAMLLGLGAFLVAPRYEYYSPYALPLEAMALVAFVMLLRKTSLRMLWQS